MKKMNLYRYHLIMQSLIRLKVLCVKNIVNNPENISPESYEIINNITNSNEGKCFLHYDNDISLFGNACTKLNINLVKWLVYNNIDKCEIEKYFDYICSMGDYEIVNFIISNFNINITPSAIVWASRWGHLEIVKLLIEKTSVSQVALFEAGLYGHYKVCEFILELNNVEIDEKIKTFYNLIKMKKHKKIIGLFKENPKTKKYCS